MDDCDALFQDASRAHAGQFRDPPTRLTVSLRRAEDSCRRRSRRALIKEDVEMKRLLSATVTVGLLAWFAPVAQAQTPGEVFRKVAPSVVVIRAKGRDIGAGGQSRFAETGSGVLITPDGKVMTAAHVVNAMDEISVEFLGGETVKARVVASEPAADLSLLQLERVPAGAKSSPLADSDPIQVGDPVIIVGAPYGLSYSLSNGLISARWKPNTVYKTMPLAEFFQTTATINTGNSGGPMFDMKGQVIGIVSHNISKSGGSEGLGFVVTINTAKKLLLEKRSFWAGIEGQILTDGQADLLNLPPGATGFIVKTVAKDSPGEQIGLRGATMMVNLGGSEVPLGGDIILTVEGLKAEAANLAKIRDQLSAKAAGSPFKVTVLRAGKVVELTGRVQ
jgi:serine protease Do